MTDLKVYTGIDGEIEELEANISILKGTYQSYCVNRNYADNEATEAYWDDKCYSVRRDIVEAEEELECLREEKRRQHMKDSIIPW